jgi:xanthine/uracil permease
MKGLENFADVFSIGTGMVGALIKSIRKKSTIKHKLTSMIVAGILCYCAIGLVEMFYEQLPQKALILISFAVGWTANEITDKMDALVDDLYEYFLGWIKRKTNGNGK